MFHWKTKSVPNPHGLNYIKRIVQDDQIDLNTTKNKPVIFMTNPVRISTHIVIFRTKKKIYGF